MKTGRNEPCPCGSGEKYKNCCLNSRQLAGMPWTQKLLLGVVALIVIGGAAVGVGAILNPGTDEGPAKVWSEEHQHWH